VFQKCFEGGLLIRTTRDVMALSPPLVVERGHVDRIGGDRGGGDMGEGGLSARLGMRARRL